MRHTTEETKNEYQHTNPSDAQIGVKENLIKTWTDMEARHGCTKAQALRDLNDELGTNYKSNRLYEWITGVRPIPDNVRDYMLRMVIESVIRSEIKELPMLSDESLDRMAARLT